MDNRAAAPFSYTRQGKERGANRLFFYLKGVFTLVYYRVVEAGTGKVIEVRREEYVKKAREGKYGKILGAYEKRETATKRRKK